MQNMCKATVTAVLITEHHAVADLGFPVGGAPSRWGGADLQRGHFLVKTYAKTKVWDPVGGGAPAAPPGSANAMYVPICKLCIRTFAETNLNY